MMTQLNQERKPSKNTIRRNDQPRTKNLKPECDLEKAATQVTIYVCLDCFHHGCLHDQFGELGAVNYVYNFSTEDELFFFNDICDGLPIQFGWLLDVKILIQLVAQ